MKIIKRALIGLGVIFSCLISTSIYIESESNNFRNNNSNIAVKFMQELSLEWSMERVSSMVDSDIVYQANTERGRQILENNSNLGRLKRIDNLDLVEYVHYFNRPNVGTFVFTAFFEHGVATVQIVIKGAMDDAVIQEITVESKLLGSSGDLVGFSA